LAPRTDPLPINSEATAVPWRLALGAPFAKPRCSTRPATDGCAATPPSISPSDARPRAREQQAHRQQQGGRQAHSVSHANIFSRIGKKR
jgi:hypothetical protein